MSKKTIAVSFIGKGTNKHDGFSYHKATYNFEEKQIEASVFCNAVLEAQIYNIDQYIIIGTPTSSWAALLEYCESCEDLQHKLHQQTENSGVQDETLQELQNVLQQKWDIPFHCHTCSADLDEHNILDTMYDYFDWISLEEYADAKIIFDITHGFRSMSALLMTAIQFRDTLSPHFTELEIIYGELNRGVVRRLQPMWQGIQISQAAQMFFNKFEATQLCNYLKDFWPEGAKALQDLGTTIQANLILRLDKDLDTFKQALSRYDKQKAPKWSFPIIRNLRKLHRKIDKGDLRHKKILILARLFQERGLMGQAIIALQLSYETFLFAHFEETEDIPHGQRHEKTLELRKKFQRNLSQDNAQRLRKLSHLRNSIAHGGSTIEGIKDLQQEFGKYHDYLKELYQKYTCS